MREAPIIKPAERALHRAGDEDLDDDERVRRRPAPAKILRSADGELASAAAAGKLTRTATDSAAAPAQALQYSSWLLADSRGWSPANADQAEPDRGAMATTFDFLAATTPARPAPTPREAPPTDRDLAARWRPSFDAPERAHGRARSAHAPRQLTLGWPKVPGAIEPAQAWMGLLARDLTAATATLFGGARVAASTADASVQSELNAGGAARAYAEATLHAAADGGEPLAADVQDRMERTLGHRFGHVRIHTSAAAAAACRALGARAFTLGAHVYFAEGELAPGTTGGDRLLRHELTHVVQYDQGRLRASGGGLEVAEAHSDTEVEARAAEHRAEPAHWPTPRPTAVPSSAPAESAPRTGAAAVTERPSPGLAGATTAGPATATAAATAGASAAAPTTGVASPISVGGALIDIVRLVSPRLATMIESGLEGQLSTIVNAAIQAGLTALVPSNPLGALTAVGASIADIASTLAGAAQGDQKCCETFATWCQKLGALARKGATSKFVQDFKKGFDEVDKFVGGIVRLFGGALVDNFRQNLNDLQALGGFLSDTINRVGSTLRAAADFVLSALKLPSVAAIEATLTALANALFEKVKTLVKPALEALKAVAKALYELSGLGALVELFKFAGELIEVTQWLIAHRADADVVKHAREQMAHTFLPKLLETMGGLVGKIQAAIAWCESHLTATIAIVVGASALMLGPLAPLAVAVGAIALGLKALWGAIGPQLTAFWNDAKALVVKLYAYAKPVIDTLTQVAFVITNPWAAPMVIASSAWLLLPECFKGPLIDLFLDLILALLEASPTSVVLFGPLWRFVRAGAIGFLTTVKNTWSTGDKVTAVNRLAHLGSGRSTEAMAGFVVGFFKGVVYGVIDPFKMVYELLKMAFDLGAFFAKLAAHSPQIAPIIQRYLPQLEARAQQIMSAGKQALEDFLSGKIGFEDLWAMLSRFMDSIEAKAAEIGVSAAGKLRGWILGGITDWDIGETIGIAIGFIVVFALITYFSAGIAAEAEGALAVVRTVAKILNAPYELLGAALKPLEAMFKPVLAVLAKIGERIGLKAAWQGAMQAFERFASLLGKMVEELIVAIEGKIAGKVASLLEQLTLKVGAELAEKLIAELGEKAAQELVEKLGAELAKKLAEKLGPKVLQELADKLGAELLEKLVDRGLTGAQIERLAGLFEKEGLELLLAEGLTGPELVRLGELNEATLRRLLLDLDAREVLELERALGKPALDHLAQDLSGAQIKTLTEKLGDQTVKQLFDLGVSDAAMRRFGMLPEDGLARFAGLEASELMKFAALSDQAFAKFAALEAPMIKSFAALDVETLRSFAFFDDAMLRKFGAIPPGDLAKLNGIDTIALRDFAAMDAADLQALLASHSVEDIRILGNMTPEKWAQSHASANSLDTGGGHSWGKHGAQTTAAEQEARLRTGTAPDGSVMTTPPERAGRFSSDAAQTEAARVAERDLYDNMVRTNGKLKKQYVTDVDVPGAGFSYSLDPPGVPPPPYLGGKVVETMCNRVHAVWELNAAGTDYVLITMYPIP